MIITPPAKLTSRVTVDLTDVEKSRVKKLAKEKGVSMSALVRRWIRQNLT